MTRFARRVAVALFAAVCAAPAVAGTVAGVEVAPPLPANPVIDTFFGVPVEDPYRFLEDTADPVVQQWMRGQADATAAVLAKLPERDALLERIKAIDAAVPAVVSQIRRDPQGRLYYLKRGAHENQFKLYRRDSAGAPEVLLVDAEAIGKRTGKPHAIGEFAASPDGRHVAYTLSASGTEIGTLHLIDATSGKEVMPPIDRVRFAGVGWLPDGSGFFHARLAPDYAERPRAERFLDHRTYFRALANPDREQVVFGPGVHQSVGLERDEGGYVFAVPGRDLALAVVLRGVQREIALYRAPLRGVVRGTPSWSKVFDATALVHEIAVGGRWLYLRSAKDAPRFKVLRTPLARPDLVSASVVVAEGREVVNDIAGARDALYVTRRDGAQKQLVRVKHNAVATPTPLAVPIVGNVRIVASDPRRDGVLLALGDWTRATRHFSIDAQGRSVDLGLVPVGPFDAPPGIESREVRARSHDGVEVPVSILLAKGAKLDGRNPLLLYGYGAYGNVEEPSWSPRLVAWLERGGIYAIAHVRGGGVYGDAWRQAGFKATKPNTWKDGIAAAEWLIANGYTGRERLSIYGGSAGGIFVGRAITERPDLFSAAVIAVGNVDSIRSESRANGAANVHEYGTVAKEHEFHALLAMSPYANVKPATPYPAVMFEHGVNDTRVDVWMALKLASRLAAATTSDEPVLLRLDYEAGHGAGATREQSQRQLADRWSFLLWRAGAPEFQPKPTRD